MFSGTKVSFTDLGPGCWLLFDSKYISPGLSQDSEQANGTSKELTAGQRGTFWWQ